jgi:hypothetical protein
MPDFITKSGMALLGDYDVPIPLVLPTSAKPHVVSHYVTQQTCTAQLLISQPLASPPLSARLLISQFQSVS